MNREAWLTGVIRGLRPYFRSRGYVVPKGTRISVGWPSVDGLRRSAHFRNEAEMWSGSETTDGNPQIFISPVESDSLEVAGAVAHEMIHCALPDVVEHGHKEFRQAMRALGFVGRPMAAKPGREMRDLIQGIVDRLGPYPHAAIRL